MAWMLSILPERSEMLARMETCSARRSSAVEFGMGCWVLVRAVVVVVVEEVVKGGSTLLPDIRADGCGFCRPRIEMDLNTKYWVQSTEKGKTSKLKVHIHCLPNSGEPYTDIATKSNKISVAK